MMWTEDVIPSYMGRHHNLKLPITLASSTDGFLGFHLDDRFDYHIWLHDENFFLPNHNPFGLPSAHWPLKRAKNSAGLYHRVTLTKQKKLNLDRRPCEEDPTYSFTTCIKEKLSQKIGCRLPWDRWSQQDRKICKSESEFKQFEQTYLNLYLAESDEIEEMVDCKKPCAYNKFKFVYSSPEEITGLREAII